MNIIIFVQDVCQHPPSPVLGFSSTHCRHLASIFESGQAQFLVVFYFLISRLILSLSFLCSSVSEALFALSFSFLSERFFLVHAKPALLDFEHAHVWST